MKKTNMNSTKRIEFINLVRAIAIFMVVLCHSVEEGIYDISLVGLKGAEIYTQIFVFSLFSIGRLGVPFFLMITGFLLLDRDYDEEQIFLHWKTRWFHLVLCTQIWFLIYDAYLNVVYGSQLSIWRIVFDVMFLNKVKLSHVWYMPMIIGIYFFIPYVANTLHLMSYRCSIYVYVFCFVILFLYPFFSDVYHLVRPYGITLKGQIPEGFSGGIYGLYLVSGYLIRKGYLKRIKHQILLIVALLSFVIVVSFQIMNYNMGIKYNIWYDNPFLVTLSSSIFEIISRLSENIKNGKILSFLSRYSFGVYCLHFMVKLLILDSVQCVPYDKPIQVFILWIVMLTFSYLISFLISLIPFWGKYLLYLK